MHNAVQLDNLGPRSKNQMDMTRPYYKRINDLGEVELVDPATNKVIESELRYELTTAQEARYKLSPGVISVLASLVREGKTLPAIAKMEGMPTLAVLYKWKGSSEDFRTALQEAEKDRAEQFHSKIIEKVYEIERLDKNDVPAMKLMLETLFRLAESDNPDKYKARPGATEAGGGNITIKVDTGIDRSAVIVDNVEETNFKEIPNGEESN